ncbi:phosphate signaling complex protein PhoU [Bacillus sp. AGMB 02131]|uniref:Phosphate-specific transport system accessory protein PhoU n=1 Tax=Peribacillus faecalis TaxID=2772559 RepID=A0A927HAC5_9BACI|nr:phosphate signaling complex protein PhoU [Peribacillus faecalis]MBD3107784.1 phosphate signaling complex protein PhoU [Peribacillus faecalis]
MAARESFDKTLGELQDKLTEMSELTVEALEKSFIALKSQDLELALEVIEEDNVIDALDTDINNFVIWLIAKEQPVARDLRRIIGALKISLDVERVADFAVNIAKSTVRIGACESLISITHLEEMKNLAIKMLQESVQSFIEEDIALAKEVGEIDDQVDELYEETSKIILNSLSKTPEQMNQLTQLLFINRHLERAADHITNIAENAAYLIKGKRYDLN